DFRYVDHLQTYPILLYPGAMHTIYCQKVSITVNQAQIPGKGNYAPPAVAAHAPFTAIRIVVNHLKIVAVCRLQQHQPITAYTEPTVAKAADQLQVVTVKKARSVVKNNEIVSCTLILIKCMCGHPALAFKFRGQR